jgi:hypothetical protein
LSVDAFIKNPASPLSATPQQFFQVVVKLQKYLFPSQLRDSLYALAKLETKQNSAGLKTDE